MFWEMFNREMEIVCIVEADSFDEAIEKARKKFPEKQVDGGRVKE